MAVTCPGGKMDLLPKACVLLTERLLIGTEDEALIFEDPTADAVGRRGSTARRSS